MKAYQKVKLITDKYIADGIKIGDIGIVLENYNDGYVEVEFSDKNGFTIALFSFPERDLEIFKDEIEK